MYVSAFPSEMALLNPEILIAQSLFAQVPGVTASVHCSPSVPGSYDSLFQAELFYLKKHSRNVTAPYLSPLLMKILCPKESNETALVSKKKKRTKQFCSLPANHQISKSSDVYGGGRCRVKLH